MDHGSNKSGHSKIMIQVKWESRKTMCNNNCHWICNNIRLWCDKKQTKQKTNWIAKEWIMVTKLQKQKQTLT